MNSHTHPPKHKTAQVRILKYAEASGWAVVFGRESLQFKPKETRRIRIASRIQLSRIP